MTTTTTLKETVHTDLRYSAWATRRLLEACAALSDDELRRDLAVSHGNIVNTLYHIYVSERFWTECLLADLIPPLEKIVNEPPPARVEFEALVQSWPMLWEQLDGWMGTETDDTLSHTLPFKLSSTSQFDCPRWQIVRHFVNHGTLHRGQIVGMLRALGKNPPCVDYMEYQLRSLNLL
jgi:uncharacterized damage-inducible protein DinB